MTASDHKWEMAEMSIDTIVLNDKDSTATPVMILIKGVIVVFFNMLDEYPAGRSLIVTPMGTVGYAWVSRDEYLQQAD